MRSNPNQQEQRDARARDLENETADQKMAPLMTSRGTKYWNSGAIPLIAPEILGNIIAEVADLGIVISENGEVLSVLVNPLYDSFRALERWENRDIRTALTVESVPKFESRLADFVAGKASIRPVELNHSDTVGSWEFPVRYSLHRIGPDGAILMLGRDLRPIAEMQQQLVKAQVALEQDYEVQREHDTRFRVLLDATTEAMVFLSADTGKVTEANRAAADLLGKQYLELPGMRLSDAFEARQARDLVAELTNAAISSNETPVAASLRKSDASVSIVPTLFRAAGERLLLCRISRDNAHQTRPSDLTLNLQSLYQAGSDAIVFSSEDGTILSANEGFLSLIDMAHDVGLRGTNLADFLQRGSVDVKVMIENAARSGRMRMYATRIAGDYGSPRPIEVSITRILADSTPVYAFVMREMTSAESSRDVGKTSAEDAMQSVKELVGQATLKEIVAETTNVVEKMCIETAVALTMNNRVATAEMLGLSRQSLYVKLRKFGLLSRDGTAE